MRGFTLIEMIAAFLVFAIAIGLLMQVLAGAMRNARQSSDYTMAALWAQSKLDGIGVVERVEEGQASGRFDDTFAWNLDIKQVDPHDVEPPPQAVAAGRGGTAPEMTSAANAGAGGGIEVQPFDLYQVDLVVTWGGGIGKQPRSAHFGTLRAVNPDTDQADGMPRSLRAGSRPAR
jgi:general secretion pathway protein I